MASANYLTKENDQTASRPAIGRTLPLPQVAGMTTTCWHMATRRSTVTHHHLETLLTWVKTAAILALGYDAFLDQRRRLIAAKIKTGFPTL
jgi:hypothetical protein